VGVGKKKTQLNSREKNKKEEEKGLFRLHSSSVLLLSFKRPWTAW
jgi:hypothetical protein